LYLAINYTTWYIDVNVVFELELETGTMFT